MLLYFSTEDLIIDEYFTIINDNNVDDFCYLTYRTVAKQDLNIEDTDLNIEDTDLGKEDSDLDIEDTDLDIEDTLGTLYLSQTPSCKSRSLISQANIPGSLTFKSLMNPTT